MFSAAEEERLRGFPEIGLDELIQFFTLTAQDQAFIQAHRGAGNRLGIAVQLCSLPWLGFVPDDVAAAPTSAVARLSKQLGLAARDLRGYGAREQTRTEHLREVTAFLGWRPAGDREFAELDEFLLARAMEHDSPTLLFRLACEQLRSSRVIRPGPDVLSRRVGAARERAKVETYVRVEPVLARNPRLPSELDGLLEVDLELGSTRAPGQSPRQLREQRSLRGDRARAAPGSAPVRRFIIKVHAWMLKDACPVDDPRPSWPKEVAEVAQQTFGPTQFVTAGYIQPNRDKAFFWDPIGWDPSDGWVWTIAAYPYSSSVEFPSPTASVEITEFYFLRKGQELGPDANETQFNFVVHNNGQSPATYYVLVYGIRNQ